MRVSRLFSVSIFCLSLGFGVTPSGGGESPPVAPATSADKMVETWWFPGKDAKGHQSTQSTGAGSENGDFFATTGTLLNAGTYEDAWNFYANKCHAEMKYSDRPYIFGRPTGDHGYLVVFQRTEGGKRSTTFALHEPESTVSVYLLELDESSDAPKLQISVVVNVRRSK